MTTPKRAKFIVAALTVLCPHCNEPMYDPGNGSEMWDVFEAERAQNSILNCFSCKAAVFIPVVRSARMP